MRDERTLQQESEHFRSRMIRTHLGNPWERKWTNICQGGPSTSRVDLVLRALPVGKALCLLA